MTKQIALVHATREAILPVETAFRDLWPEAAHWTLLDESLTLDLAAAGGTLTRPLIDRFLDLAAYAAARRPDGILFTCSAFGRAIDEVAARHDVPVMKPNEAVLDAALAQGGRVGLLATHPQTLPDMTAEMEALARHRSVDLTVVPLLVEGAWADLGAGRRDAHDRAVVEAAPRLNDCGCIVLAQFSMAPLAAEIGVRAGLPVLTSPHAAVAEMKRRVTGA
ncbi:MAG: arylsulfatase [Rhodospirillales bacterium CG15_BIG_FIL_POST_REV_8_21_14_020_66_15]|nr:MAG: arylsulfatase [Rhodospirillales bacterium CG15_BIG_FIL_POST_REV_8_21_14_020_66_15]